MENLREKFRTDSIIFTHGDSDGVCAGAIAKSAYPDSHVYFTSPVNLLAKLDYVDDYKNIIICDIAVDERTSYQLHERLDDLSNNCNVIYIDHHPLPHKGWDAPWFYHDLRACASEIAYEVFQERLDWDIRRVAIYGAIGDFSDNTAMVNEWCADWDKRSLYFQAGTLIQAVTYMGRDHDFKRSLIEPLSHDTTPSEIPHLLSFARKASEIEEDLRLRVKKNVKRLDNIAYVVDTKGYMSKSAIYAASYGRKDIGMAAEFRHRKDLYDLSIRSRGFVDVNRIIRSVAPLYGGTGGGHSFAAGARIPADSFEAFLREFDNAVGKYGRNGVGENP